MDYFCSKISEELLQKELQNQFIYATNEMEGFTNIYVICVGHILITVFVWVLTK